MNNLKDKIFTKESAIRHLIIIPIMILVLVWNYFAFTLIIGDQSWLNLGSIATSTGEEQVQMVSALGAVLLVALLVAYAVYWNVRLWMFPCLLKAVCYLIGAIPIVNLLISEDLRSSWFGAISDASEPAYSGYWSYDPDWGWEYDDGSLPFFIAIPLGIISAVLNGVIACVWHLIKAVGIPVFCPILTLLALWGISVLLDIHIALGTLVGLIGFAVVGFVCIAHPIISLRKK